MNDEIFFHDENHYFNSCEAVKPIKYKARLLSHHINCKSNKLITLFGRTQELNQFTVFFIYSFIYFSPLYL